MLYISLILQENSKGKLERDDDDDGGDDVIEKGIEAQGGKLICQGSRHQKEWYRQDENLDLLSPIPLLVLTCLPENMWERLLYTIYIYIAY